MKAVFEALKIGNVEALQQAVTAGRATGVDADTAEPLRLNAVEAQSGLTAVQLATLLGSVEAIDLLRAVGDGMVV